PTHSWRCAAALQMVEATANGRSRAPTSRRSSTFPRSSGVIPDVAAAVRAEVATGHGLSRATLDRLTCDCSIARVITDGPSQVLDVGRATRTWPTPIRRAIEARDGGC